MAWISNGPQTVNVGPGFGAARGRAAVSDDAATRAFLPRVFQMMALGLGVTGLVAMLVASSPAALGFFFGHPGVMIVLILAQLGMVFAFSALLPRVGPGVAAAMFFSYAALMGITFSAVLLVYTGASIAGTFFVTAGAFAGLAAYGAITKRNLDGLGSFLFMGLIGLVIASLVNMFLHSPAISWITSCVGVIVFTGLTAYDTNKLKQLAANNDVTGAEGRKLAFYGALTLYLDFINLFMILLRFFGSRRSND
jgi:uncharacterized protein